MVEIWKGLIYNNIDYSDRLEISTYGRLRNKTTKHIYKLYTRKNGYIEVNVSLGNRGNNFTFKLHRCVACTFIPNPENKPTVNHKDGKHDNNYVENLEWATSQEQAIHSTYVLGFQSDWINNVKPLLGKNKDGEIIYQFDSLMDCARYINLKNNQSLKSTILSLWRVLSGRRKTFMGLYWEYI